MRAVGKLLLLLSICCLLLAGCGGNHARWLDAGDRTAFSGMIAEVQQAQVIFVGEYHDQPTHHALQLDIIKGLRQGNTPLVIGLEMFDMESQPALDQWVRGTMGLSEFMANYQQNWSINWVEYDTILLFARNKRIPLVALNAPFDLVQRVSHRGFKALSTADLARLPKGVTGAIAPSYRSFLEDAFFDHQLDENMFGKFCEAQGVRNNTMGRLITLHLNRNPGTRMVVITGVGHAMRRAVAGELTTVQGLTTRVIVPVTDGMLDRIDRDDADYFVYPKDSR